MSSCALTNKSLDPKATKLEPTPPKSKLAKAVEKVVNKVIVKRLKLRNVSVRYDASANSWAIIDATTYTPKRHFSHGIMTGVTFKPAKVRIGAGCGSRDEWIGIANGDLIVESIGNDNHGWKNLCFNCGKFDDGSGGSIDKADQVRLMPDRRALWK